MNIKTLSVRILLQFTLGFFVTQNSWSADTDLTVFVQRELGIVIEAVQQSTDLYTAEEKALLIEKQKSIQSVLTVSEALPTNNESFHTTESFQLKSGAAIIEFDGTHSRVRLNESKFRSITDPVAIEGILHHELAMMSGLEMFGDYHLTDRFISMRKKQWQASVMLCNVAIYSKKVCTDGNACPDALKGSGATPLLSFGASRSGMIHLFDTETRAKTGDSVANAVVFRYSTTETGLLRGTLSQGPISFFKQVNNQEMLMNEPLIRGQMQELIPETKLFNLYEWMQPSEESTTLEFEQGFLMFSCTKL